jgi:hypothetical protein
MITPSYSLTATERVLPKLALDFTTAALDPRITFTRSGNTATVTNSSGVIVGINADLPRFDFDPVTLVCRGLLIEEPRTNSLLNSLIDGTSLATQSVTVTAAARTLSFYGTGQIVLSGAASATVTGIGAYPTRTTFTFTPSAGTLTLTVTGTVQFAQLEIGSFSTSFIPTSGAAVTRNADVATMTGANFSNWFNASEGTFVAQASIMNFINSDIIVDATDGTASNRLQMFCAGVTGAATTFMATGGATQGQFSAGTISVNTTFNFASAYKVNALAASLNSATPATDTSATIPSGINTTTLGCRFNGVNQLNGHFRKLNYYPQRLTNAELQAFSK